MRLSAWVPPGVLGCSELVLDCAGEDCEGKRDNTSNWMLGLFTYRVKFVVSQVGGVVRIAKGTRRIMWSRPIDGDILERGFLRR